MLGQILLACKALSTEGALVPLEFEVSRLDVAPQVKLAVEPFATLIEHAAALAAAKFQPTACYKT